MLIYFVVLAIVVAAIHLASGAGRDELGRLMMYAVAFVALVLVSALRADSVGSDALTYGRLYGQVLTEADVVAGRFEIGFLYLYRVGRLVSDEYIVLFTLVGIIVSACFLWGIRKNSVGPTMSAFILLTSGVFFFSFNGLRQGIAIALVFLAIGAAYRRRFWVFLPCVVAACLFHTSAIVAAPMYFMVPRKSDSRYNVLIFVIAAASGLFFAQLVNLAGSVNPRYLSYGKEAASGRGLVFAAFLGSLGVFFLYFRRHVRQYRPSYNFLVNVYLLGLVVAALAVVRSTGASGVMRASNYFCVSQVLLWPIVFVNLQGHRHRTLFFAVLVGFYLVYYGMTLEAFSNLVPYTLNHLVQDWFSF